MHQVVPMTETAIKKDSEPETVARLVPQLREQRISTAPAS
jgi:hypothetical protein